MPNSYTPNYNLELQTSQYDVPETWFQRTSKIMDRVLYEWVTKVGVGGVINGWSLTNSKTITAGSGVVGGCLCTTSTATDVASLLTSGATNYLYATTNATSPEDGTVTFGAVTSVGSIPASAVRLGSITLNSGGDVTAVDDNPAACLRDLVPPIRRRRTPWTTHGVTCGVGETVEVAIDHSAMVEFAMPGEVEVDAPEDVRVTLLASGRTAGGFVLLITNNSSSENPSINWRVEGLV